MTVVVRTAAADLLEVPALRLFALEGFEAPRRQPATVAT
jgi:hypothetical protein